MQGVGSRMDRNEAVIEAVPAAEIQQQPFFEMTL
jgi:hypothetical protein